MIQLVTRKKVQCTHCGKLVSLNRARFVAQSDTFPQGEYEMGCPHCGATFTYDAEYIKQHVI